MDADLESTYVDCTPTLGSMPFPTLRFAPRSVVMHYGDIPLQTWLASRYDVGVPHTTAVESLQDGPFAWEKPPLATARVCLDRAQIEVREATPSHSRRLKKRGYEVRWRTCVPFEENGPYHIQKVDRSLIVEELEGLVDIGIGLERSTWRFLGDAPSRRLGWTNDDLDGMRFWLEGHPNLMRYARQEIEGMLLTSRYSGDPVHICPRFDGSWHVYNDMEEYGCGMLVVQVNDLGVSNYIPEQNWLACALQHKLFDAVSAPLASKGDFKIVGDRYAEFRW